MTKSMTSGMFMYKSILQSTLFSCHRWQLFVLSWYPIQNQRVETDKTFTLSLKSSGAGIGYENPKLTSALEKSVNEYISAELGKLFEKCKSLSVDKLII